MTFAPSSRDSNLPQAKGPAAQRRAFPAHPVVDHYFGAESIESARRRIGACLERGDGPAIVVGAPGCGKTMLLEVLAAEFTSRFRVVRLASTQLCTRRALLQAILYGLGESFRDREEGELRLALVSALEAPSVTGPGVALLIDEAQSLPARLLEELRLLSNSSLAGEPRLRVVLAGTAALDEVFTSPELSTFSQRLAARCYLAPLSRDETTRYVRAHVAAAGADPDELFAPDAYNTIHLASDGVPRVVNQVCDRALVLCVERGAERITAKAIEEAWSDLHQLPAPWHTPALDAVQSAASHGPSTHAMGVIEFGQLDDELDDFNPTPRVLGPSAKPTLASSIASPLFSAPAPPVISYDIDDELEDELDSELDGELELDHADDEPVALAFPILMNERRFLAEAPQTEADGDEPVANDPFDEPFDEEEIVLDRFAGLESVIPAGSQAVVNRQDTTLARVFEAFNPAVSSLLDDVAARMAPLAELTIVQEVTAQSTGAGVRQAAAGLESQTVASNCPAGDDSELLVVEDDALPAAPSTEAVRQDYRQLFAGLRQG
ncbi:MAG: ExeA family protein [Lacipirellulaceae bacterium]